LVRGYIRSYFVCDSHQERDKPAPFDWKRYHLEHERKQIEEVVQRKFTRQITEAGFRALAAKLHPDAGGSNEAMARLSDARDAMLKQLGLEKLRPRARHVWKFEWKAFP
jgi:hypothetical protein